MARCIVFDQDAARAIEQRLRADGFAVTVTREPFAGEDDDEDHPWAVDTDAPAIALDLLLEAHDGWLDDGPDRPDDRPATSPAQLLDLPDAPRRRHRD